MKNLGVLVLLNVGIITTYLVISTTNDAKRICAVAGIGLAIGVALIMGDRLTKVKVPFVGEITAATERAIADAKTIEQIKSEVEQQRDSIKMITRDANSARDDIKRIEDYATVAQKKSEEATSSSQKANEAQKELSQLSEFNLLLTKANNDDRESFQKLINIANKGEEPFKKIATQAVVSLATKEILQWSMPDEGWSRFSFNPQTASIGEYMNFMTTARADLARMATIKLWEQERFSKAERLETLSQIIKDTTSIDVLNTACDTMDKEAKVHKNILAWSEYLRWWDANKNSYASEAGPKTENSSPKK